MFHLNEKKYYMNDFNVFNCYYSINTKSRNYSLTLFPYQIHLNVTESIKQLHPNTFDYIALSR